LIAASGKGSLPGKGMFKIEVVYVKSDFDFVSKFDDLVFDFLFFFCNIEGFSK
jgi:hypothetical protein